MKAITLAGLCLLFNSALHAQASLASEDMIEEIVVKTASGADISYTLVKDAVQADQWYYMPSQARLYEFRPVGGGENEPEFNLIKYQYNNPKNPGELLEGGIIQFSLVMAPDATSLKGLRDAITAKTQNPNVRLAALPLKSAAVSLVTPKGDFIVEGSQLEGIAPLLSNAKMVFSVALTKMGTDIYDALTKSNTGMGVAVKYSYNGLTPPAGFKITVDWDQTYKYYSRNDKKAASIAGAWKWLGGSASYTSEKQKMTQELIQNKALVVEAITGEGFTDEMLFKYIDPILARINKELFETDAFGKRVDSFLTAKALDKDTSKPLDGKGQALLAFMKVNAHMSVAIKDIKIVKKGKEVITFNIKHLVERHSISGGFVGLGAYSPAIRKKLEIIIAGGKWESAFFVLPPVSDDDDIGIKRVGMEIKLTNNGKLYSSQVFNWTKEKGWTDRNGTARAVSAFPLLELAKDDPEMTNKSFELKATINAGNSVLEVVQNVPAGNSENNIALPISLVDIIKVDPELLTFKSLNPGSKLAFVTVGLSSGDKKANGSIKPRIINGVAAPPKPFYWLIPKSTTSTTPVTANIVFTLADGTKVNWKGNGRNLNEPGMSHEIVLIDADYQNQQ